MSSPYCWTSSKVEPYQIPGLLFCPPKADLYELNGKLHPVLSVCQKFIIFKYFPKKK